MRYGTNQVCILAFACFTEENCWETRLANSFVELASLR